MPLEFVFKWDSVLVCFVKHQIGALLGGDHNIRRKWLPLLVSHDLLLQPPRGCIWGLLCLSDWLLLQWEFWHGRRAWPAEGSGTGSAPDWQLLWEKGNVLPYEIWRLKLLLSSHPSVGLNVLVQSSLLVWGRGGFLQPCLISCSLPPLSLLSLIKYFERKQMGMLWAPAG